MAERISASYWEYGRLLAQEDNSEPDGDSACTGATDLDDYGDAVCIRDWSHWQLRRLPLS